MANKVLLEVELTSKGIKIVEKQLDKVTKAVNDNTTAQSSNEKATKRSEQSRGRFQKKEKGVAQATANSTKAFSKQAQGIDGTLVPAYAALAARIFALSAAFNALAGAARAEQLAKGLEVLGTTSGVALGALSKSLQEATGNALSLEEAMRSTNLVISSGFGADTIERLGQVAKTASIALGRDTADSLARLTRGAAKLEPELLDELGIMVRLDEAAETYARELGKTANQLTNFEKRTAFMNAVLEEGERKFSALGDAVDANPFDKLSASLQDLSKTVLSLLSSALSPLITLVTESTAVLSASVGLLATTFLRAMVPGVTELSQRYADLGDQSNLLAQSSTRVLTSLSGMPKMFSEAAVAAGENALTGEQMENMYSSLSGRIIYYKGQVNAATASTGLNSAKLAESQAILKTTIIQRNLLANAIRAEASARLLNTEAMTAELFSIGMFGEGMKSAKKLFEEVNTENAKLVANLTGRFPKALARLAGLFGKAAIAGRLFLTVLVTYAVPIALTVAAVGALFFVIKKTFDYFNNIANPSAAAFTKNLEKMNNQAEETKNTLKELKKAQEGLPNVFSSTTEQLIAQGNAFDNIKNLDAVIKGLTEGEQGWFQYRSSLEDAVGVTFDYIQSSDKLRQAVEEQYGSLSVLAPVIRLNEGGLGKLTEIVEKYIKPAKEAADASRVFAQTTKEAGEASKKFFATLTTKSPYDELSQSLNDLAKAQENLTEQQAGSTAASSEEFVKTISEQFGDNLKDVFGKDLTNQLEAAIKSGEGFESVREALENSIPATAQIFNNLRKAESVTKKKLELLKVEEQFLASTIRNEEDLKNLSENRTKQEAAQRSIAQAKIDLLDTQIEAETTGNKEIDDANVRLLDLLQQRKGLQHTITILKDDENKKTRDALRNAREAGKLANNLIALRKTELDLTSRLSQETGKALELEERQLRTLAELKSGSEGKGFIVTAQQEKEIQEKLLASKVKQAEAEYDMTLKSIALQYDILDIKLMILEKEAAVFGRQIDVEGIKTSLANARIQAENNAATELANTIITVVKDWNQAVVEGTKEASLEQLNNTVEAMEIFSAAHREAANLTLSTIDAQKRDRDATKRKLEAEAKLENLKNSTIRKAELTGKDILRIEKQTNKENDEGISARVQAIMNEATIKENLLRMEAKLLKARLQVAKQEAILKMADLASRGVDLKSLGLDPADMVSAYDTAIENVGENLVAKTKALASEAGAEVAEENLRAALTTEEAQSKALAASANGSTVAARVSNLGAEGGFESLEGTKEKIAAVRNLISPMTDQLKSLGPEGELVAAVVQGSLVMADSFVTMSDSIKEAGSGMEKGAAIAGFAAQAFAQVGAIMQASSNARIAGIDKEIEAEKKRDGKSKQSLERIRALEKKKDAEKRKAFEANKKVMMATTVANTAAAMLSALAPPPAGLGPVFGPVLAGIAGAMGAAQLAIIAGTSYDGGGSASVGTMNSTSVTMGERKSTVDLAKTQGGAGELGYLRGQKGTGGPENFTPAFMGAKYRAAGGPTTGYVVGEQGPELFVPETAGRIVPNNEIQQSAPVTANISISALDASGVEEVLVGQRGNIIGMMREAANSYGQNFMEEVDTAVYTPSAAGARKY